MEQVHDAERLKELQALPLDRKIQISQARIIEWNKWCIAHGLKPAVSFSGGKDSTVLLHLVRTIYPDVPAVFSNTGLEYGEIQRFVRTWPNVQIVTPKMRFDQVISKYGYPLIGKEVAEAIYYARRLRSQSIHVERERESKPLPCGVSAENSTEPEFAGGGLETSFRRAEPQTDGQSCKANGGAGTTRQRKTLHGLRSRNAPQTERPHEPMADSGTSSGSNLGGQNWKREPENWHDYEPGTRQRHCLSGFRKRQAGVTSTNEQPTGTTGEGGVFSPESKEQFGEKSIFNKEKWLPLTYIPAPISHYCCQVMKKSPLREYQRKTKTAPYLGTLAEESRIRTQAWIRHGCNAFDSKKPTSQPLSFWTEQDILQYLMEYGDEIIQIRRDFFMQNLHSGEYTIATLKNGVEVIDISDILERDYSSPIAAVYGDIVAADEDGNEYVPNPMMCAGCKLKTTGANRTGCIYCAFGFHLEKGETRFQRLARTHPRQYEYALGGGQWVDNPAYDPTAPEYDGAWRNWNPKKIWVPSKKGIGLKAVFDMANEIYGKDFYRYE